MIFFYTPLKYLLQIFHIFEPLPFNLAGVGTSVHSERLLMTSFPACPLCVNRHRRVPSSSRASALFLMGFERNWKLKQERFLYLVGLVLIEKQSVGYFLLGELDKGTSKGKGLN